MKHWIPDQYENPYHKHFEAHKCITKGLSTLDLSLLCTSERKLAKSDVKRESTQHWNGFLHSPTWIHTSYNTIMDACTVQHESYKLQHYNGCLHSPTWIDTTPEWMLAQSNVNPHTRMDACTVQHESIQHQNGCLHSPVWIHTTPEWMLAQSSVNPHNTRMDSCTVQCESTTPEWMPAQSNVKPCNTGRMLAKTDMNHETLDWMFALWVQGNTEMDACTVWCRSIHQGVISLTLTRLHVMPTSMTAIVWHESMKHQNGCLHYLT